MEYIKIVRALLGNKKLTIEQQISGIKQKVSVGEYKDALKFNPLFNRFLHKSPFFKTPEDIYVKEVFQFTGSFRKEYKWLVNILENYLEEINLFVEYKNRFESHFILGEFDKANTTINEVENLFGISLWSIEANLLVEEYCKGSEANWNKLTYYLTHIKNPFYEFIINSGSKRIESKLSYDSFVNQFQNDIDNVNAESMIIDFFVFKNFTLANYEFAYKSLESVLFVSNIYSIIDQYLTLIDVIIYNIAASNENEKLFLPFVNKVKDIITNDQRIVNIYNIINDKSGLKDFETNVKIIACLNYYYSGDFEKSLKLSIEGIKNTPLEFKYYEIYCKSLINLNLDFQAFSQSTFINNLLEDTFCLLSFRRDKDENVRRLLKTAILLMNFNIGKQIYGLLSEIEGEFGRHFISGVISTTFNSPQNLYLAESHNSINTNFNSLFDHHCFKVYNYKLGNDIQFDGDISLSKSQNYIYRAIEQFKKKNYKEVIELLNGAEELDKLPYYFERKISLLYNSYLNMEQIRNALLLFGNVFLDDRIITRKIDYQDLFKKIKGTSDRDQINFLIELPLLYSLIVKEYDLYEIYDEFLCSHEIFNIRDIELEKFIRLFSLKKVIYFLQNVAVVDTLKYSTDYGSISDVEEDRIFILSTLIDIDSSNKLIYEKEINEIYRVNSVRKVLKEVDEGRLYIDVNSLKEIQVKKFTDDFKRFKEIEFSASSQSLIGFNPSNTKNWEIAISEKNDSLDKFNSADYLAFKSIYLESRDNLLFSKEYGLDSCLSTRIRHGALRNHIRSVFEKLDLVTSKSNDRYLDNEIWQKQLLYHFEIDQQVQNILKILSREIDDYTTFIVNNLIQIQTEKTIGKEHGLFKYFTNDMTLHKYYLQNKDNFETTERIIEMLLTSLVNHTVIDLQNEINEAFTNVIPNKFQSFIDSAIIKLRELNIPSDCQLIPNLIKSSTEIQKELEIISDWFYLNTTCSSTLLGIDTVIDASIELTNKINPQYKISPTLNLECDPFGVYSSLVFVFNMLFNNIIQHSKLPPERADIHINIESIGEQYFRIEIRNKINNEYNYSNDIGKLEKIKENWNNHTNIERSNKEGESGFDKIKRILLYEALSKTDKFDFSLENDFISIQLFFPYLKFNQNEKNSDC